MSEFVEIAGIKHTQQSVIELSALPLEKINFNFTIDTRDSDNDGIINYDEIIQFKTDPYSADTDGDKIIDGIEIKFGLDPLSSDSVGISIIRNFENAIFKNSEPHSPIHFQGWFYVPTSQTWYFANSSTYPYVYDSSWDSWMVHVAPALFYDLKYFEFCEL